ncbi:MAG: RDD family protein [candidate division NC10 bacterium]
MAEETEIFWESGLAVEPAQAAPEWTPAGFWIRFVASLLDDLFMLMVGAAVVFIARFVWGSRVEASAVLLASLTAFSLLFGALYYILLHWILGQTLGKALLRLRVVTVSGGSLSLGTSVLRWIGYLFSLLPFLACFVMAGLRPDKRARHDLIAGTRVVRV